ncbi:MAG TPA: MBOAT family protein, partial [Bacteroidia bacterium]|nr:MBOAT family protein [Bacteroidia bacterium]
MLFNSFEFIIFFIVVTTLYFVLPNKIRWLMLLLASCVFYMFFIPKYILILFLTIIIDYIAGIVMEKYPNNKKSFLILSLVVNIGILFFFKYFNFFIDNVNSISTFFHWSYSISLLKIILPIGLSFHTFQAMSYTIEVYRGNQKAEKHLGTYALYVM